MSIARYHITGAFNGAVVAPKLIQTFARRAFGFKIDLAYTIVVAWNTGF